MLDGARGRTAIVARLLRVAKPRRGLLLALVVLSLASVPLTLLGPVPVKLVVDNVLGNRPLPWFLSWIGTGDNQGRMAGLAVAIGLMVSTTLLTYIHALATHVSHTYAGEQIVLDFRSRLFEHAMRLSLAYHDRAGSTDAVYRIQWDANAVQSVLIGGGIGLVTPVVTVIGMVIVTAWIDWRLAVVALIVCPILYAAARRFRARIVTRWHQVRSIESMAMAVVQEVLSALRIVKAFGRQADERDRFVRYSNERIKGYMSLAAMQGRFDLQVGLTMALGTAAVLMIGVQRVDAGALSVGNLLIVVAYVAQMYEPLKTMSQKLADLQSGLVSVERAFALFDQAPEVHETATSRRLERAAGSVSFRNVAFTHDNGHRVLQDVSFDVEAGARVGISGQSGAGKTTLLNLLMRFYDPTEGAILLDGVDIRSYELSTLRSQFALVLQDSVLFSTTIVENIRYGRPSATDDDVLRAARDANAHEFITRLPDKYQTAVGERGMCLSGGERQRIALARAFLRNAPLLILDEPTSAVDRETEAAMLEALERLMRNRTTFIISHRVSALQGCDLLLEIGDRRAIPRRVWPDLAEAAVAG